MRDEDRYLFDLQGYLTVPDALSPETVDKLNDAIDELVEREMGPLKRPVVGSTSCPGTGCSWT